MRSLQTFVEKPLPEDFIEFYENCDGKVEERCGVFAYGVELRDLNNGFRLVKENDENSDNTEMFELIGRRHVLDYVDPQIDSSVEYSKFRIPIATATRMDICIDLNPSSAGTIGQIIFIDHEYRYGIHLEDSLSDLLETFRDDLSNDLYRLDDQYPGQLIADDSIDLSNWYLAQRWSHLPKPSGW